MATEQTPPQFGSGDIGSAERSTRKMDQPGNPRGAGSCWTRGVAAGALATGAGLIAGGKRRPGLIAAAAGVMVVLLERPEDVSAVWAGIPRFIQASRRLLDRTEDIVQDLTSQAETVRDFLDKATAQHS